MLRVTRLHDGVAVRSSRLAGSGHGLASQSAAPWSVAHALHGASGTLKDRPRRWGPPSPGHAGWAREGTAEDGALVIAARQIHDVVVVGAGPAGSATAILLARAGRHVVLLDRARFPRPKACGGYVSPGAAAVLARLGVFDFLDPGVGRSLRGMELRTPGGARYLVEYRDGRSAERSLAVPRDALDLAILRAARASGARVLEGFRVGDLLVAGGQVQGVDGYDDARRPTTLRTRLVVGADGTHSIVARKLGLQRPVRWPPRLGLATRLAGVPWSTDYGEMHLGRHGYVGVAPSGDGLVSVGLVGPLPRGRLGPVESALGRALAELPDLAARLERGRPLDAVRGVGPLGFGVRSCAGPGFALVGDAAGFFDPFTGEGIFRAVRGAEILAGLADRALATDSETIDVGRAYERARQAAFQAKERLTTLIQLFVRVPSFMEYAVDRLRRRPALATRLGWVLGDLAPAEEVVRPGFLWSLLRP
jgi:menaquinone-9 beta-reductase